PRAAATVSDLAAPHQYNNHNLLLTLRTPHLPRMFTSNDWYVVTTEASRLFPVVAVAKQPDYGNGVLCAVSCS
ncbi:MAG: hypothetical protein ACI92S_004979, partial [Planctomycetaceae bacterium]